MEDDKRVNYKLDAINKLINNLKLSISGNKEHDELGENNVIVNLDEISQKITELHEMVKAEFDEFENQHKSESDETQTLLNNRFDKIDAKLDSIKAAVDSMKTTIGNKLDTVNSTINKDTNYNSVYLLKKGVNHSDITIDNIQDKCYFIGDQANTNNFITEFDFRFGPYFVPNKVGTNKKADYNWKRGDNGQDTDKAIRVLLLGGGAANGSSAGSGFFYSNWVRPGSLANVGFFTTVKLD